MNRFGVARTNLVRFRRNVFFRANARKKFTASELAEAAHFAVENGRSECFSRQVHDHLLDNVAAFNRKEHLRGREELISQLFRLNPTESTDHVVRIARASVTSSQKSRSKLSTKLSANFQVELKKSVEPKHLIFQKLLVDEEIDLVRYVIKYGEEKAHKVFQFTLDRLERGEYTPEEKFKIASEWVENHYRLEQLDRLQQIVAALPHHDQGVAKNTFLKKAIVTLQGDFERFNDAAFAWLDTTVSGCDLELFEMMIDAVSRANEVPLSSWRNALEHCRNSNAFQPDIDVPLLAKMLLKAPDSPKNSAMLTALLEADFCRFRPFKVNDAGFLEAFLDRSWPAGHPFLLKQYNPPQLSQTAQNVGMSVMSGGDYLRYKSCPIVNRYFDSSFERDISGSITFLHELNAIPKEAIDRSLDLLAFSVTKQLSDEEMAARLMTILKDDNGCFNRELLNDLLSTSQWLKVIDNLSISPLELWYHGVAPEILLNDEMKYMNRRVSPGKQMELIPLVDKKIWPDILDALCVPDRNRPGTGVFNKFNAAEPWAKFCSRLLIKQFLGDDKPDDKAIMNFIDYEGPEQPKADFNIRFHVARTLHSRFRVVPSYIKFFNEEVIYIRGTGNVAGVKRNFIREVQRQMLETQDKSKRRQYEIMYEKVKRKDIQQALSTIEPTVGTNWIGLPSSIERLDQLYEVFYTYSDWIYSRMQGNNVIYGQNNVNVKIFTRAIQQYDEAYRLYPEARSRKLMTTFRDFTRGQSKLGYLSFANRNNIDRYCKQSGIDGTPERMAKNKRKQSIIAEESTKEIVHPIVTLSELLQDVMHKNEVPHPTLFPCNELFSPALSTESRIRTLLEDTYQIGQNYDSALISKNQRTFEKLNRGEFPLMSFKAKYMIFPIYLNPRFHEEQMRQRVETIMYYRRDEMDLLLTKDKFVEFLRHELDAIAEADRRLSFEGLKKRQGDFKAQKFKIKDWDKLQKLPIRTFVECLRTMVKCQPNMLVDLERPENQLLLDSNSQKVTWDTSDRDLRKPDAAAVDQFIVDEFKSYFIAWARWQEVRENLKTLEIESNVDDRAFYISQMNRLKSIFPAMVDAIDFKDINSGRTGAKFHWDAFFSQCRARNFLMAAEMINQSNGKELDLEQIKFEFDQWLMVDGEQTLDKAAAVETLTLILKHFNVAQIDFVNLLDLNLFNSYTIKKMEEWEERHESMEEWSHRLSDSCLPFQEYKKLLNMCAITNRTDEIPDALTTLNLQMVDPQQKRKIIQWLNEPDSIVDFRNMVSQIEDEVTLAFLFECYAEHVAKVASAVYSMQPDAQSKTTYRELFDRLDVLYSAIDLSTAGAKAYRIIGKAENEICRKVSEMRQKYNALYYWEDDGFWHSSILALEGKVAQVHWMRNLLYEKPMPKQDINTDIIRFNAPPMETRIYPVLEGAYKDAQELLSLRSNPREPLLQMALFMQMVTGYYGFHRSRSNSEPMSRRKVVVASKNYAHMLSYCLQAQRLIWSLNGRQILKFKHPVDIEGILNQLRDELIQMWRYDGHLIKNAETKDGRKLKRLSWRRVAIDPDIVAHEMSEMPEFILKDFADNIFHLFNTGELMDSQDLYLKELTEDAKRVDREWDDKTDLDMEMKQNHHDFSWEKLTLDTGDSEDLALGEYAADKFDFGEDFEKLKLVLKRAPGMEQIRMRIEDEKSNTCDAL